MGKPAKSGGGMVKKTFECRNCLRSFPSKKDHETYSKANKWACKDPEPKVVKEAGSSRTWDTESISSGSTTTVFLPEAELERVRGKGSATPVRRSGRISKTAQSTDQSKPGPKSRTQRKKISSSNNYDKTVDTTERFKGA